MSLIMDLELTEFLARTGMREKELRAVFIAEKIVSLRDLVSVVELKVMPVSYLVKLLSAVTLTEDESFHPYAGCRIITARIDPSCQRLCQTFIQRDKYQKLVENLPNLFCDKFCVNKGFAKCNALIVLGETANNELAIAHYLPPIVEVHEETAILDGSHRNFLIRTVGTTIESIQIIKPKCPLPCRPVDWADVKIVEVKPPKEERHIDLISRYYRNLKFVGIDG